MRPHAIYTLENPEIPRFGVHVACEFTGSSAAADRFARTARSKGSTYRDADGDRTPSRNEKTPKEQLLSGTAASKAASKGREMAKSVNRVFLLGNTGRDPEIRSTGSGKMVANFSLATAERYKDQQGNWQERTEWHNIVVYDRLAEIVRDYVKKGSKLFVEGRLNTRNWEDKDHPGRKVYRTEIIVSDLSLLSGREEGGTRAASSAGPSASFDQRPASGQDDFGQAAEISDEDIPF
jgi:single-strand DNA-binding protein